MKTKYTEIGRHRGMTANENIRIGSNSYEKGIIFKYWSGFLTTDHEAVGSIPGLPQF